MKNGSLIQDHRKIDLTDLVARREGPAPCISGEVASQNVSPSIGDASLVIEGEEFDGNVVRQVGSQIVFESARFEEIAKKIS